jgi:Ni,Fe-hydrogenase III large subunit/Ni,Fe-hydrogenase III component G
MTSQELMDRLKQRFGEAIASAREPAPGAVYLGIAPQAVGPIADCVSNEMGARFLITTGTDERPLPEGGFRVSHIFSFDQDKLFCILQTRVNGDDPEVDAITPKVRGAMWAERELFDVVGVKSRNHPDPRRLLLADDWPAGLYPLRKDVPFDIKPEPDFSARPQLAEPPEGASVLPIGPFFPVLEEPAYFRVFVEGETVVGCDYRGFYNHRGIEKLGDSALTYNQVPFLAERICGICGFIHSTCYCQAVEQAVEIEVPARARFIRSLMLELERVHSHILWLGIAGHIIGFDTILMQAWRIREPVMWLCEKISGNRKTYGMNLVGGVRRDIPKEDHEEILGVVGKVEREMAEVIGAIVGDTPLIMRLKDVGPLPEKDAREICVAGPTARGSNVAIDSRIDHPYAAYPEIGVEIKVQPGCDVLARTLVRLEETMESIRQIRVALHEMPDGPIMARVDAIPAGREGVSVVEAPRGEAIHYVLTGDDNHLYRWRVRAPTYPNLQAVPTMIQGQQIADVPISIGSIDPCFSCTERMEVVDTRTQAVRVFSQQELLELSRRSRR